MPKVIVLKKPNVVVHASSPGAQEAEVGGLLESMPRQPSKKKNERKE
jgi:hypothetical protein